MRGGEKKLDMSDGLKVVVRGLPYEARMEQVLQFFGVNEDAITLPTWSDSGRVKGFAFVECSSMAEKQRIEALEGAEFEADGNCRTISISDYVEKAPRQRREQPQERRQGAQEERSGNFVDDGETGREIFVSNISFDATSEDFEFHFGQCGEIESVTIPTIYRSGRPKGMAFVRFTTVDGRQSALELDGSVMMERTIGVRENRGRSQRRQGRDPRAPRRTGLSEKPQGCTTLFVGNLPWSVEDADLEALFQNCGTVTGARIVRKNWNQQSRGFGYVEFQNEADVDTAVQMQLSVEDRELRLDYADNLNR